jgi:hypothetical protein
MSNVQIDSSCVASLSYVVSIEFTFFGFSYLLSRKNKKIYLILLLPFHLILFLDTVFLISGMGGK